MNDRPLDRSTRFARWWVRRYTAGLAPGQAGARRAEIDSDLAEHEQFRRLGGRSPRRIQRERLVRLIGGMPADVGWRRDVLRRRTNRYLQAAVASVSGLAALLLAGFYFVFAAYMLGHTSVAERRFFGGLASYADEVGRPIASPSAATIIASLGLVLVVAAFARPISPTMANVVTIAAASWSILFFWLGVWPIGVIAVIASAIDLATRTSNSAQRS